MKRLFTFGCSYTYFYWPTWADFLSLNYDHYENWGWAGLGNRAIAERIAECHSKHQFTEDDTIVVQWSTHMRHDWYNERAFTAYTGWQTNGNIYAANNLALFSKQHIKQVCSEDAMIMHTLNNILLIANFLDNINCTWKFTSIGDIRMLGTDLDSASLAYENQHLDRSNSSKYLLYDQYPKFKNYQESIWETYKTKWIEPITYTAQANKDDYWYFKAAHDPAPWAEAHPSPIQHYLWLVESLLPALGMQPADASDLITTLSKLKSVNYDANKFERYLNTHSLPQIEWPHQQLGY